MNIILLGLYIFIIAYTGIYCLISIDCLEDWISYAELPNEIYRNSEMNWFGVMIIFILEIIFFPIQYMFRFLYWICHVGRKEE